ncbi:MAG TPA: glycosyltransferase family 1 protein [Nitrospiraceae bacterium]|nr:glycosyltransferase family 1 protein [Nitrospiraceae bacterium]
MRIGIDANPLIRNRGGVGWHMYHLLQALVDLKEDLEFVCYVERGSLRRHEAEIREQWKDNPALKWIETSRLMRRWRGTMDGLDLYHGMNFRLRTAGRCGAIVTIHDVWLDRNPHLSPKLFGQRRSFIRTKRMAQRAAKVITVSEHSAGDIVDLYGLPREKIAVIYNGVSQDFRPTSDPVGLTQLQRRLSIPTERFILFAGGADPRKNHQTLLKAYARCAALFPSHSLIMVGDVTHRFGDIRETARTFDVEDRIICPGPLSLEALRLLYAHADVFVFPSLYEGFGMPVLEAMACGTPVITSRTTSLPEVAGDAAVLVNPEDAEELADAIMRVLDDDALQSRLRSKGLERVKQFTWQRAARQTLSVYREVVNNQR